jgi:hypothetical protein
MTTLSKTKKPPKHKPDPNMRGTVVYFTDTEREILRQIGHGSMVNGMRVSIVWAAHFYQLGLDPNWDLNHIGLVTVSTTDQHPNE